MEHRLWVSMKQRSYVQKHWEFVTKSFEQDRISHANILSGNDGEAKKEFVFEFVRWMICEHSGESRPCKQCRLCAAVTNKNLPDMVFVDAVSSPERTRKEITISQIRDLKAHLALKPWIAPYKVALIFNADFMNQEAQSAFLKALEEPKGNAIFFLLCEHPIMLLETIRSRTQELPFYTFETFSEAETRASPEIQKTFQKLLASPLYKRFEYAKKLAESPEEVLEVLSQWLSYTRVLLRKHIQEGSPEIRKLRHLAEVLQETLTLLRNTNISTRFAIEKIMLEV